MSSANPRLCSLSMPSQTLTVSTGTRAAAVLASHRPLGCAGHTLGLGSRWPPPPEPRWARPTLLRIFRASFILLYSVYSIPRTFPASSVPSQHPLHLSGTLPTFPACSPHFQNAPHGPSILHTFPSSSVPSQHPSHLPGMLPTFPASFPASSTPSWHAPHVPSILHTFPASTTHP